jgi:phospholipase D1/2
MERILDPGRNCQGIYEVRRSGLIIDGSDYYRTFYNAALKARNFILISGWQFDSDVQLLRGDASGCEVDDVRMLPFLNTLCDKNRELRIYILAWDFSPLFAFDREWFQKWIFNWTTGERIYFLFDSRHSIGASHHQKFVVIDGTAAFAGGLDICANRWDDRRHLAQNPERVNLYGQPYEPYHDIQSYHEGPVAEKLKNLFLTRWKVAGGGKLKLNNGSGEQFGDVDLPLQLVADTVAISRTQSRTFIPRQKNIREIRSLYTDAVHAARKIIYMENQYFSSQAVFRALTERMQSSALPRLNIVFILPRKPHSLLEELSMGVTQMKMLTTLRQTASEYGHKLGIYYTLSRSQEGEGGATYIHAKLLIVDDRFLTVGSANTSNRSMGLDTELNVSYESAGNEKLAASIYGARISLIEEHSGIDPKELDRLLSNHEATVEYLDGIAKPGVSRLRPHTRESFTEGSPWLYKVVPESLSIDPEKPVIEENVFELISRDQTGFFAEGISMLNELVSGQRLKQGADVTSTGEVVPKPYVLKLTRYSRTVLVIKRYSKHIVLSAVSIIFTLILLFIMSD